MVQAELSALARPYATMPGLSLASTHAAFEAYAQQFLRFHGELHG